MEGGGGRRVQWTPHRPTETTTNMIRRPAKSERQEGEKKGDSSSQRNKTRSVDVRDVIPTGGASVAAQNDVAMEMRERSFKQNGE